MSEFVKHHEVVVMFLLCLCVGLLTWHYERWQDRRALQGAYRFTWQCVQFGGGASVTTPKPLTEEEACEWVSKLGAIAYVDKQRHKIFYRARVGG